MWLVLCKTKGSTVTNKSRQLNLYLSLIKARQRIGGIIPGCFYTLRKVYLAIYMARTEEQSIKKRAQRELNERAFFILLKKIPGHIYGQGNGKKYQKARREPNERVFLIVGNHVCGQFSDVLFFLLN